MSVPPYGSTSAWLPTGLWLSASAEAGPMRWPSPRSSARSLPAPLGIGFGHISLSQIKRNGEDGRGLHRRSGHRVSAHGAGALVLVFTFVVTRAIVEDIRQYNPNAPGYTAFSPVSSAEGAAAVFVTATLGPTAST